MNEYCNPNNPKDSEGPNGTNANNVESNNDLIDLSDLNSQLEAFIAPRFPDGIYQGRIIKASVRLSKAGKRQIVYELELRDPVTQRTIVANRYVQLDEGDLYWVFADFEILGISLTCMNDLHAALKRTVGTYVRIQLKDSDGWYFLNFVA